ncbi:ParB/RepB/Spo0J family partition protein [Micromonospora coerulea]|uniref:ParB/RepB/Spo0J family partition protein n=1 Tax=Micromonospora coerulea TaxID=47856 RepID=UPI0019089A5A|nr:ParB/RepB/Spo0J family partition protein [Micromonospora veneta]
MSTDVSRDTVPVALIDPDPDQPRRHFDPAGIAELAESMRTTGLAERILVRPASERYVIVCGERRWRAARSLGWVTIPADVRDVDPADVPYLQLAENITRSSLSPMEEARSFRVLLDRGDTQQSLAARIGKDRSYVAQKLRLLDLPAPLALLVDRGALSEGHVRQLLRIRGMYKRHTIGGPVTATGSWASLWAETTTLEARRALGFQLLRAARPVDWPAGYPFEPRTEVVFDAINSLCTEVERVGPDYPRWVLPAFYFAVLTVEAKVSVANLDRLVDCWIDMIHAALIYVRDLHAEEPVGGSTHGARARLLWWGHRADLRHAGLLDDNVHISLADTLPAMKGGTIALPSECQPGGPQEQAYADLTARIIELGGGE